MTGTPASRTHCSPARSGTALVVTQQASRGQRQQLGAQSGGQPTVPDTRAIAFTLAEAHKSLYDSCFCHCALQCGWSWPAAAGAAASCCCWPALGSFFWREAALASPIDTWYGISIRRVYVPPFDLSGFCHEFTPCFDPGAFARDPGRDRASCALDTELGSSTHVMLRGLAPLAGLSSDEDLSEGSARRWTSTYRRRLAG